MNDAKRGDFIVIESVSRVTTLCHRTAEPAYTVIRCGIIASACEGIAITARVNGQGRPIRVHDVHGFKFAHTVPADRLHVAEAVKACSSRSFESVDGVRDVIKTFLVQP